MLFEQCRAVATTGGLTGGSTPTVVSVGCSSGVVIWGWPSSSAAMKLDNASSGSEFIETSSLGFSFPAINTAGTCVVSISSEICSLTATLADNPSSEVLLSIVSQVCSLTATLAAKDNPSSDALLAAICQTAKKRVASSFLTARRGIHYARACSL